MAEKFFKCDVKKSGLSLGIIFALFHLGWSLLVIFFGSSFISWVLGIHSISSPLAVSPVDITTLIIGLISAFVLGSITGALFAYIYNRI